MAGATLNGVAAGATLLRLNVLQTDNSADRGYLRV